MDPLDNYPKRDRNSSVERKAEVAFEVMLSELDGLFEQHRARRDYGTDYELEVTSGESVTNVRLHVQLKGTEKDLNADGSVSVPVSLANVNYLMMQPYSFYVCYHVPTKSLRVRSTESVVMSYARHGENWTDQKTITVIFTDLATSGFLEAVARLALLRAIGARSTRDRQLSVASDELPNVLRRERAVVHVPDDAQAAAERLRELFEAGMDEVVSEAFDRFAAVLGTSSDAMIFCFMAEINLGMTGGRPDTERVEAGLSFLTRHMDLGRFKPGSLLY
jgi:hypothetical protein